MKTRNIILKISLISIFSALIFVFTSFISIPYGGGMGYFNASDGLIMFATAFLGPIVGTFSGIIGCSLGDLFSGYAICIPFTICAKTIESVVFFLLFNYFYAKKYLKYISYFIAPLFMVLSYIPYYLIYDDEKGALALVNSCFDLIQGVIGGIIGITICQLLSTVNLPAYYIKETIFNKKNK